MKILVLGFNNELIRALEDSSSAFELFILEEPDIYERHIQEYKPYKARLKLGEYQFSTLCLPTVIEWHSQESFDAVLPGKEYAVQTSQAVASTLGLRSPGHIASQICTNKLRLREHCEQVGLKSPRFTAINSLDDLRGFWSGTPIVLKPSNRHGSLGVRYVEKVQDLQQAWDETCTVHEGNRSVKRALPWSYQAEDFMQGTEYSVEIVRVGGESIFANITDKVIGPLPYFPKIRNSLPTALDNGSQALLLAENEKFLDSINADSGIFHAEWKLSDAGPVLLECAARFPGGCIPLLISLTHNINLAELWAHSLTNSSLSVPAIEHADVFASFQYLKAHPGRLHAITGLEHLNDERIVTWGLNVAPGDVVGPSTNSHNYPGYFVAAAATRASLGDIVDIIDKNVAFHYE